MAPDVVALTDAHQALTFAEVEAYVSAVGVQARALLAEQRDAAFLPVLVDRSVESCICVLACLLARVPFTPIDRGASPEFMATLLRRIGSPEAVLSGVGVDDCAVPEGVRRVESTRQGSASAAARQPEDLHPGVVIFTSGSTGRPKGVVLSWGDLDRRWRFRNRLIEEDARGLRAPLTAPLDSMAGIAWLTDISSGFSHLVIDAGRLHPGDLLLRLREFEPSHVNLPAPLARMIAQLPERRRVPLPTVRQLSIGTEGFRYEVLQGLRGIFSPATVVRHGLASTEGGRILHCEFTLESAPAAGVAHVGLPYFPQDVRVRPVDGIPEGGGELLVGGAIASEYFDDPELSHARFVTDDDGRRWWRSGDLIVMTPEGLYRHAGRLDDVIKVGGRLASPSAVASVLLRIDGVRAAVVVPQLDGQAARLVAHVEVDPASGLTLERLRATMSEGLPAHLMPSAILRHEAIALTSRGKPDRAALADGPFLPW